jgi:ABC-type transport system involved in cytochrome bd biosynthesis fused ATPase/permease subunit
VLAGGLQREITGSGTAAPEARRRCVVRLRRRRLRVLSRAAPQPSHTSTTTEPTDVMTRRETTTRQAATEELWDALGAVGLADVVAGVLGGLDTQIGWNGAGLSGGQARRLALARARLLRRCELTAAD